MGLKQCISIFSEGVFQYQVYFTLYLPFGYSSRPVGNECHSLTSYALKRVSLYFVLMWYIENSLFYQISVEMSFTVGLGVGYKD